MNKNTSLMYGVPHVVEFHSSKRKTFKQPLRRKNIFAICLVCLALRCPAQLVLQNSGRIHISSGTHVIVNGNLENKAGGDFRNDGVLTLTGNFTNNQVMTEPGSGTLKFESASAQTLDGTEAVFVKDVVLNNSNGVTIGTPLKVDGEFNFVDGIISTTNSSPILFTTNGSVSPGNLPSDVSHVNGYVVKEGTGDFTYPVGDGTSYQPVATSLSSNTGGMRVNYVVGDAGTAAFGISGSEVIPLASYNKNEYWDIAPLESAAGNVTLFWDDYNPLSFAQVSDLRVAHKNSNWLNEGGHASGTTTTGSITSNTVTTWSPFTLGGIYNPLPVSLISFTGSKEKGSNLLSWKTTNEKNFSHFVVQHSRNASSFTDLAVVEGSSTGTYHYTHTNPFAGINYYRLKMVDRASGTPERDRSDGSFAQSKMISLSNEGNGPAVYPNPASSSITLNVNPALVKSTVTLYAITGRVVQSIILTTSQQEINISSLTSGVYILKFADGTVERFVKE